MKKLIALTLISLMSSFSFAEPTSASLEPLMGVLTTENGVFIQTHSGGCTSKDSFIVKKQKEGSVTEVAFWRVQHDPCLALYFYGTILGYSYEELGLEAGENFIVRNPMTFSKVR